MNQASAQTLSATLLLDPAVVAEPSDFYRRLLADAPVWRVPESDVVVVSSFDAVVEATNRVDDFSSSLRALLYRSDATTPAVVDFDPAGVSDALATADPPLHTVHRAAVFPELVARRMATLRPDVEALTETHIDHALTGSPVEVMATIANAIPIRVVSRLIGFRDPDPDRLLAAAFDSTAMLAATGSRDEIFACMERTASAFWYDGAAA